MHWNTMKTSCVSSITFKGLEMNLYKISQDVNDDWDTFDSAVVVAESAEEAKKIIPYFTNQNIDTLSNFYADNELVEIVTKGGTQYSRNDVFDLES